jgi:two-component system chemotaxis response regulator CheY
MPRILIIDDSAFQRQFMRGQLEEAGFEVEDWLPVSALEILGRIRDSKFDLVISDYNMPHVDGLTVLKMVKRADAAMPVIILTAIRNPEREARLEASGASRILHKPLRAEALAAAVKDVLAERG